MAHPQSSLLELFDAVLGNAELTPTGTSVVFTDNCSINGAVTGNTHVVPAWSPRVYAVFENAGNLRGLDCVLVVWRNLSNDRVMLTECEPLTPESNYNNVWLQKDQGWPPGNYQLDLCNPERTSEILVRRMFSVK